MNTQLIKDRILKNLGTTITGLSLNYDLIANGIITKDYASLGKGLICVLVFSLSEDPFKNSNTNTSPTNTTT